MKLDTTHVIALANQKGGCGKTTAAVSISAALARKGYLTSLVDVDPQCNATDSFGVERDELERAGSYSVADAYLGSRAGPEIELDFDDRFDGMLRLISGHRGLGSVSHRLDAQLQAQIANANYSELDADDLKNEHRKRLRGSLQSLRGKRDFVIIDTPPDLGFLMTSALIAADWFIIPVFPSGYDLKGLETLWSTAEKVQSRYNSRLRLLGVLVGNFDRSAKLDSDIVAMLGQTFREHLIFQTTISRSVKHREATVYGKTIFEHAGDQPSAEQYLDVAGEIVARIKRAEEAETATTKPEPEARVMEVENG